MNIFSVKYMNEATTSLADKVIKTPVNETYLFSTMRTLNEMNKEINEATKNLYIQINEAETKEDENKIFAAYFYQFKDVFHNFRNKVEELKSRLVINVENKVDTWKDVIKNDCEFNKEFTYSGYKFHHIDDSNYPRFNLHKLYQKEFDYIGKLMQDSKTNVSPNAKLKIIASVSNNFVNYSANRDWIKGMIRDMVDVDNKEINGSYSECIYNSMRDKYDINVNKAMLYTCKENLCDYEDVLNAGIKMCDDLLRDLDRVAEDISSYVFRNQDKKLKIKTDTDGIIDADYRLDTYSMNELDLFMKNKVNQVKKVLNIYAIAIGIKFDTIVDYIDQNINIIRTAIENDGEIVADDAEDNDIEDIPSGEEEPAGDDMSSSDDIDDNDPEFADNGMSDDGDESFEDNDDFDIDFGETPEEPSDDESFEEPEAIDGESGDFEEAYLFEAELFELEMMYEAQEMYDVVNEALFKGKKEEKKNEVKSANDAGDTDGGLTEEQKTKIAGLQNTAIQKKEAMDNKETELNNLKEQEKKGVAPEDKDTHDKKIDEAQKTFEKAKIEFEEAEKEYKNLCEDLKVQPQPINGKKSGTGSVVNSTPVNKVPQNLNSLAAKRKETLWTKLMDKLAELWKKFREKLFSKNTKEKSEYVSKHKEQMMTEVKGEGKDFEIGMNYTPNIANLDLFDIPDLNYAAMRNDLVSDEAFVAKYFPDWSEKYSGGASITDIAKELILGEEQELKNVSQIKPDKINEIAYEFCVNYNARYKFLETLATKLNKAREAAKKLENVTESSVDNGFEQYFLEDGIKTSDGEKRTNVDVYFRVCSRVLTALMTVYEKLFNELYSYCKWHISKVYQMQGKTTEAPAQDANAQGGNATEGDKGGLETTTTSEPAK